MPPIKSIALFAPNHSALYLNIFLGLRKEFAKRGVDVHLALGYYKPDMLAQFCDLFKPDAILEIDRTRANAPGMPEDVISIAWLQDWRSVGDGHVANSTDRFGGSDLYYFCARPESIGVNTSELKHWAYLLQATDADVYYPETLPFESDFTLLGYIPEKQVFDKLDVALPVEVVKGQILTGNFGTLRQLVDAMKAEGLTWNTYDPMEARRLINRYVRSFLGIAGDERTGFSSPFGGIPAEVNVLLNDQRCFLPDDVMFFFENGLLRALGRSSVLDSVLRVSQSLRIFGVGPWATYPEYASYYRGLAATETEVRRIYSSSRINLHNAMTQMHTRALDCMASGSIVMVNKIRYNDATQPDCLRAHFEPGVHYCEYGEDDLSEVGRQLLDDEPARRRMGQAARAAILAKHTWAHRVDQILSDIAGL
jgi:hypothetical protein